MGSRRHRLTPGLEPIEARIALSGTGGAVTTPPPIVTPTPADSNVAPPLAAFAKAYLSVEGQPNYNPAADTNHNGVVGPPDADPILQSLAAVTPRVPPRLTLTLAPGEQVRTPHPANSGGVTREQKQVTILGHTTPNSLVFLDDANNDFRFRGGSAIAVDASGNFSLVVKFTSPYKLTTKNLLVETPFLQQIRRAFPILRLPV